MRSLIRGVALVVLLFALGGCKQGEGERCQIASDCADGLVCAPSSMTCVQSANPIDAGPSPDSGAAVDAAAVDVSAPDA